MVRYTLKCRKCGEEGFPHFQAMARHQMGCTGPADPWPEKLPPDALEKAAPPDYQGQYTWGGQEAPEEPAPATDCTATDSWALAAGEVAPIESLGITPAPWLSGMMAADIPVVEKLLRDESPPPPSSGMSLTATRAAIAAQLDRVFGKRRTPARTENGGYR